MIFIFSFRFIQTGSTRLTWQKQTYENAIALNRGKYSLFVAGQIFMTTLSYDHLLLVYSNEIT